MKKIIVDLDVVTVANYSRKSLANDYERIKYAQRFLNYVSRGVKSGEFWLIALKNFDALLALWKYKEIVIKILDFYHSNSSEFVDTAELITGLVEKGIDYDALMKSFTDRGVKGEDVLIVLVASLKRAAIITFNKKDLRNRREEINKLLLENGLNGIEIKEPYGFFRDNAGDVNA